MVLLANDLYEKILQHASKAFPLEACGLLGGTLEGEQKFIREVYLLQNLDQSPEHFSMDPREQFEAVKDMRKKGFALLGNFHSHPATPARPSEEDKRLAFDSEASYFILSLANPEAPVLKSFSIHGEKVREEILQIIDEKGEGEKNGGRL